MVPWFLSRLSPGSYHRTIPQMKAVHSRDLIGPPGGVTVGPCHLKIEQDGCPLGKTSSRQYT